jgi:hypothetical protein
VLSTDGELSEEGLIADLVAYLKSHTGRREFGWRREIKGATAEEYNAAAMPAICEAQSTDHELADWFSSFANPLIEEEGVLEPTPFDMTVAQQRFLAEAALAGDRTRG